MHRDRQVCELFRHIPDSRFGAQGQGDVDLVNGTLLGDAAQRGEIAIRLVSDLWASAAVREFPVVEEADKLKPGAR